MFKLTNVRYVLEQHFTDCMRDIRKAVGKRTISNI